MSDSDRFIYGAEKIKSSVKTLIREGRLHHAYLIDGAKGTGKKSLVKYIAYELCGGENADERTIKRISEWAYPDIRLITKEEGKKNISVNSVREMIDDVYLTPTELDFKLYAFDCAETLSSQAQNALLKVIEEPPAKVYIFLLCENASQILQTIRSRVQKLTMPLFSREETEKFIKEKHRGEDIPKESIDIAVNLSNGSLGRAEELLFDEKARDFYNYTYRIIEIQAGKNRKSTYFDMINTVIKAVSSRENADLLIYYLQLAYRDIINAKSTGHGAGAFFSYEDAEKFAEIITLDTVIGSVNALKGFSFDYAFNFNYSLAASSVAVMLWRVA